MLQPNLLIFPRPKHQDARRIIQSFKEQLIFIPRHANSKHLDNLITISKQRYSQRFTGSQQQVFNEKIIDSANRQFNFTQTKSFRKLCPLTKIQRLKNRDTNDHLQQQKQQKCHTLSTKPRYQNQRKINSVYSIPRCSSIQTTARNINQIQFDKKQSFSYTKIQLNTQMKKQSQNTIPCLLIKSHSNNSQNILIYYHANAEDMINCYNFVKKISSFMQMDILVVEYPGYSIYQPQQSVSSFNIMKDIRYVMGHLNKMGYLQENLIIIGRSIGTGPSTYIATKYKIKALVLLSPFTSFKQIVQNLYGSFASYMMKQIFNNLQICSQIECPVLIIHGLKDKLITFQHSLMLAQKIKTYCTLKLIPHMTHNNFNYENDFLVHFKQFLQQITIKKTQHIQSTQK